MTDRPTGKPRFFKTPAAFRAWLGKNHAAARELLVGFYKRDSGTPSMTWPESVDAALRFGWIDGIRRGRDDHSYTIRFALAHPRVASALVGATTPEQVAENVRAVA